MDCSNKNGSSKSQNKQTGKDIVQNKSAGEASIQMQVSNNLDYSAAQKLDTYKQYG